MTVKAFMEHIGEINNLIPYTPLPEEGVAEADRIQSNSEAELRNILKKAVPGQWRDTQAKSNLRFATTTAQVQYYEKLRNIDERSGGGRNSNNKSGGNAIGFCCALFR